jgi:hypothetical protein
MNMPVVAKKKNERSESVNSPGEVRVAYPYFHKKRTKNAAGQPYLKKDGTPNPRNSGTFMFPKLAAESSQCANYMFLWGLAVDAARKMWPQNVDASGQWVWPQGARFDVKDGDQPLMPKAKPGQPLPNADEIAKKNGWRRGYWIIEAEHFFEAGPRIMKIVNGHGVELPAQSVNGIEQYKSGDFGFVNIHAWAYENETFGVNFGFDGFLFTREGERIGSTGQRSAAQMFAGVAGMVAPAPGLPGGQGMAAAPGTPPLPPTPGPVPPVSYTPPAATYSPPNPPAGYGAPPVPYQGVPNAPAAAPAIAPAPVPPVNAGYPSSPPPAPQMPPVPMSGATPSNLPPLPTR